MGHEVLVFTTNANGKTYTDVPVEEWVELEQNLKIKYYHDIIPTRLSLKMLTGLWSDLKSVAIVYTQAIFSVPTPLSLIYSSLQKKAVVVTPRGALGHDCLAHGPSSFKTWWLRFGIKPWLKRVAWQATSKKEQEEILTIYPGTKSLVVPNDIHCQDYQKIEILNRSDYLKKFASDKRPNAEALASGTPIIASKNTPWSTVEENNCGRWINNTPEQITKTMLDLIDNHDLTEMGKNGKTYVHSNFDWMNLARKLAKFLQDHKDLSNQSP